MPDARLVGLRRVAIVPAYNEAGSVAQVIAEIRTADPAMDVVVVDDGSRDATASIASRAGAVVLRLPFNLGIGGAVQTGYRYALENGYQIAIQVDGDGQHLPTEIPKLLEPILSGRADMVVGTRWRGEGDYKAPLGRRIGIELFARLVS
ncbi:MAG: glycosyltransferase family 2 protein [Thermoleophilia bacterium]